MKPIVRVLSVDQINTPAKRANEQNDVALLKAENARLKREVDKYYNESHHYKNKCLELYEKLQDHQIDVDIQFLRVAG